MLSGKRFAADSRRGGGVRARHTIGEVRRILVPLVFDIAAVENQAMAPLLH